MTDKPPEWSIRCPWCKAPPGRRCTTAARGRRLTADSHDIRITTWTTARDQHTGDSP